MISTENARLFIGNRQVWAKMRNIQDILDLRRDISPFLIHLTRQSVDGRSAHDNLFAILAERSLRAREGKSDIQYGGSGSYDRSFEEQFLKAVSFSETPLEEVHCLLEVKGRQVNLEPYGVVFLKKSLASRGVSPALYLNNLNGDQDEVVRGLFELTRTNASLAKAILPLFAVFGKYVTRPGNAPRSQTNDWRWEREWRYPANRGRLSFDLEEDVFAGLCQHDEIQKFEGVYPMIPFIDPRRPMRWYSSKLIARRRSKSMSETVV